MRRPFHTVAALTGALAITLAACGGDDDDSSEATDAVETVETEPVETEPVETEPVETEPPATEAPTTEAPTTDAPTTEAPTTDAPTTDAPTTTEAAAELGSIVEVLTADGRFTTLVAAIDAAGMTDELSSRAVTLLAPTDEAIAALGQPAIDALLADPVALLDLLQGHVLAVPQDAALIGVFDNVLAINSASWPVVVDGETLMIGPATVIEADIDADNGVIQVLDAVLVAAPAPAG